MDGQRAPVGPTSNTKQTLAPRKTGVMGMHQISTVAGPAASYLRPDLPPAHRGLLMMQQTIGNRAVAQSLQAGLELKQSSKTGDLKKDLAANMVVDGERKQLPPEAQDSQQQPTVRDEEQGQMLSASSNAKIDWGLFTHAKRPHGRWGTAAGVTGPQAVAWGAIQNMAADGQAGVKISGPPGATDILTIQGHGGAGTLAWTYFPTGYKAPNFNFNSTDKGTSGSPKWYASPTSTQAASEGTANAYYPTAGRHKTLSTEGGKDVYWNVDAAMSTLGKDGEQEHCDDHAEAYKISLKEAEEVLTAKVYGKDFGPKPTQAEAEQLVLDAIRTNLTHAALGDDKTKWAGKYNTLFRKTGIRDTSGWHSVSRANRTTNAAGDVTYDIVAGTSKIGVVKPSDIIKY